MNYKLALYRLREGRDMHPRTFASLVGTTLYEHRFAPFFVTPIVIGLHEKQTVIVSYDSIGTQSETEFFVTGGTAGNNFYSLCESYYKEGLTESELERILSNILLNGSDRDILSGYGGVIYTLTPKQLKSSVLKTKLV